MKPMSFFAVTAALLLLCQEQSTLGNLLVIKRAKWESKGITDYSFRFNWSCNCPRWTPSPIKIVVVKGKISQIWRTDTIKLLPESSWSDYYTIDGVFDYLAGELEKNPEDAQIYYDDEYGYPKRADIDYEIQWKDDEMAFRADSLVILKGD
jgi:hypothetical protein